MKYEEARNVGNKCFRTPGRRLPKSKVKPEQGKGRRYIYLK